jgi:hypothetical protein
VLSVTSLHMKFTVLALKFVYDLDGKKATLMSMSDDIGILAFKQARVNR